MILRRKTIATLFLGTIALTAQGSTWDKLLQKSQASKLRAELRHFQVLPVDAPISSEYGNRVHPISGINRQHKGIDMAASENEKFVSVAPGRVITADFSPTFGHYLEIQHKKGIVTRYAHANELSVKQGQRVSKGQVIGLVGRTGQVTGTHLHFEVIKNGRAIDPAEYIMARKNTSLKQFIATQEKKIAPIENNLPFDSINKQNFQQVLTNTQLAKIKNEPTKPVLKLELPTPSPIQLVRQTEKSTSIDSDSSLYTTVMTTQSMWGLARDLKSDLNYQGHLTDIIDTLVKINPRAFKNGNSDYRFAHVPLKVPSLTMLDSVLSQTIKTQRSIWAVAEEFKIGFAESVSVYQVLNAFLLKNSEAFVDGNIQKRLSSVPLRIPTELEVLQNTHVKSLHAYQNSLLVPDFSA